MPARCAPPSSACASAWSRRTSVGGTCLHEGCIPTKALLHAAEVADAARDAAQFGVRATLEGIDMAGVNAYKDGVVSRLFKGLTGLVKCRGITVIEGAGRLTGPREVTVDGTAHTGRHVVLASGSLPAHRCPASTSTASGCSPPSRPCASTACRPRWSCSAAA